MRSVVCLSQRKKKVVQHAEEPRPSESSPQVLPEESPQKNAPDVSVTPSGEVPVKPPMAFDISKIDPKTLKMAEDVGIPIVEIIQWANSVEQRLEIMQNQMPQQIRGALEQAIEAQRQKQMEQIRAMQTTQPSVEGGGGGNIQSLLPLILQGLSGGGGGGGDSELLQLSKEMMKLNMDSIRTDIDFSKALKNALVAKIAGKAVGAAAESVI